MPGKIVDLPGFSRRVPLRRIGVAANGFGCTFTQRIGCLLTLASGRELGLDGLAPRAPLIETLRRRRGQRFYPSFKGWPNVGAHADTPLAEIPPRAHYFSPNADKWLAEVYPGTGRAWGFARFANMPDSAEWGSVDLTEIEALYPSPFCIIERDLDCGRTAAGTALAKNARQALETEIGGVDKSVLTCPRLRSTLSL